MIRRPEALPRITPESVAAARLRDILEGDPDAIAAGLIVVDESGVRGNVAAAAADSARWLAQHEYRERLGLGRDLAHDAALRSDALSILGVAHVHHLISLAGEPLPPELRPNETPARVAPERAFGGTFPAVGRAERVPLSAFITPGRSAAYDEPEAAARRPPVPTLDPEGFPQRSSSHTPLDSLNNSRPSAARGALALSLRRLPRTEDAPGLHANHGCCQDRTTAGPRSLVGYTPREEWEVDETAGTYTRTPKREAMVLDARCRCWRCGCCKWRLRRRNRKRALKGALGQGRTWFVTITLDRKHPLYRAFRDAELAGQRVVIRPGRKRRGDRSGRELAETRFTTRPRRLVRGKGADRQLIPVAPLLGAHRGRAYLEPGGRLLTGDRAETLLSIRYASQAFNRLSTMLARHFGHRVAYYRALELHPGDGPNAGIAHVHMLLRTGSLEEWFMKYSGPRSWRSMLARAGFGEVTKVEAVRDHGAASRYVTKMTAAYTSKDMSELPRWTRRGAWSRDWCEWEKATPIAGFAWVLAHQPAEAIRAHLIADGYTLADPERHRIRVAEGLT